MNVQMPDGTIIADVPDGITQSELLKRYEASKAPVKDATPGKSWFSDLSAAARAVGFPKVAAVAESIGQGLSTDQRGIGQVLGRFIPGIAEQQAQDDQRLVVLRREAGLDGFDAGKFAGSMMSPVSVAAAGSPVNPAWRYLARPGAMEAVKRGVVQGAVLGGTSPVEGGDGMSGGDFATAKAQQMGLGAALGAAGNVAGELVSRPGAAVAGGGNREAQRILQEAGQAGYVFPPNMIAENGKGTFLQSLSGKIKTAQAASDKNQEVTNRLVRTALGMQAGESITGDALQAIRRDAGQAYKAIQNSGITVAPDESFLRAVSGIGAGEERLAKAFPMAANQSILGLRSTLAQAQEAPVSTALEAVKRYRADAAALFDVAGRANKPGAQAEATAMRAAADAIEDLIGRSLQAQGKGDLVPAFEAARVLIAKSHTVEKAIDGAGNITASKLVDAAKKGKTSGELELIGKVASAFPKAVQNPTKLGGTLANSPLDWVSAGGMGVLGSALGGSPAALLGAGAMLSRPLARNYILSPSMQKQMLEQGINRGLLRSPAIVPQLSGASMGLLGAGLAP